MKKLCTLLLGMAAAVTLTGTALADVIWDPFYQVPGGSWTVLAVIAVIVVTILLIRRNGKNK